MHLLYDLPGYRYNWFALLAGSGHLDEIAVIALWRHVQLCFRSGHGNDIYVNHVTVSHSFFDIVGNMEMEQDNYSSFVPLQRSSLFVSDVNW